MDVGRTLLRTLLLLLVVQFYLHWHFWVGLAERCPAPDGTDDLFSGADIGMDLGVNSLFCVILLIFFLLLPWDWRRSEGGSLVVGFCTLGCSVWLMVLTWVSIFSKYKEAVNGGEDWRRTGERWEADPGRGENSGAQGEDGVPTPGCQRCHAAVYHHISGDLTHGKRYHDKSVKAKCVNFRCSNLYRPYAHEHGDPLEGDQHMREKIFHYISDFCVAMFVVELLILLLSLYFIVAPRGRRDLEDLQDEIKQCWANLKTGNVNFQCCRPARCAGLPIGKGFAATVARFPAVAAVAPPSSGRAPVSVPPSVVSKPAYWTTSAGVHILPADEMLPDVQALMTHTWTGKYTRDRKGKQVGRVLVRSAGAAGGSCDRFHQHRAKFIL